MALITVLLSLAGCSLLPATAAESGVQPWHPRLAALAAATLEEVHYSGKRLDDEISAEWLDRYIDVLDYDHTVFLASDVAEFRAKYATRLDDDLHARTPNVEAAFEIWNRYRERLRAREGDAISFLDAKHDFTLDEVWDTDRDDAPFPETEEAAREMWRLKAKAEVLEGELAGKDRAAQLELLKKRSARRLRQADEREPLDVMELYLLALCQTYDPHTVWFKPATNDDFDIDLSNSVEGIGATLRSEDGYTVVENLVEGGPADLSGELHKGDRIVAVAQGDGPPADVVELTIDKVVKQIRGPKGSRVKLTVIPFDAADPSQTKIIEIVRDKVQITNRDAQYELETVQGPAGPVKVGVIEVPSFYLDANAREAGDPNYNNTTDDVAALLAQARKDGVDVVAIDLRDNGGGSLSEAVSMTGLFIDTGPVVAIREPKDKPEIMSDEDAGTAWDGPLVVYTSDLSASASEIFAGAIQDYGRGLVIGSPSTHGKGTVQTVLDLEQVLRAQVRGLPDEPVAGALKLTTHTFFRVSGKSTQREGVHADVVIPSKFQGYEGLAEADLDHALPFEQIPRPAPYTPVGSFRELAVPLQRASDARVASDQWFKWQATDVSERIARRDEPLSLNLAKRKAQKAEAEARLAERGLAPEPATPGGPPPEPKEAPDYVLQESLKVTADLVAALDGAASTP